MKLLANKALWLLIIVAAAAFALGKYQAQVQTLVCEGKYEHINSRIVCGQSQVINKDGYAQTQEVIVDYINQEIRDGRLTEAGVYFRDLENGPVFGVNETLEFAPASLLKLPLALTYLNSALDDSGLLDRTLAYQSSVLQNNQFYPPSEQISPNQDYPIKELLRRMIEYSDNNSYALLNSFLEQTGKTSLLQETYVDLGLTTPDSAFDESLSVRRYASIFRILYNVSFLDQQYSELVLDWLSKSNFNAGLRVGVPNEVKIAHKFGERIDSDNTKQLHDCGIIYFPENPYLLCVMTRGQEFPELAEVIGHISQVVYQEIDSRRLQ